MNQKVYIVIDYDDNDRVLLINVDKNMNGRWFLD